MTDMNTWKREDWLRWLSTTVIPQAASTHRLSPAQQASAVHAVESSIPSPSNWTHRLVTPPTLEGAARPGYPDLSEDYPLEIVDIGHSSHTLILSSDPLSERITTLQRDLADAKDKIAQLEALDATNKADIERSWTFTPEHLARVRNDPVSITNRLRGDYGGRSFPMSAICIVAADMLDESKKQLTSANATIADLRDQLAACATDAKAALRMVRFTGEGVYGDYYTDDPTA